MFIGTGFRWNHLVESSDGGLETEDRSSRFRVTMQDRDYLGDDCETVWSTVWTGGTDWINKPARGHSGEICEPIRTQWPLL